MCVCVYVCVCVCVCVCMCMKNRVSLISHNFSLEGPIPTIQIFFSSWQWALSYGSYGTLNSKHFFYPK